MAFGKYYENCKVCNQQLCVGCPQSLELLQHQAQHLHRFCFSASVFLLLMQHNQFNKQRLCKLNQGTYPSWPHECFWAPPVTVRKPVWLLGLDEQFLLSIRTVSSTEWLSLITANIISHKEFQSPPEQHKKTKAHQVGPFKSIWRLAAKTHTSNCAFSEKNSFGVKQLNGGKKDERIRIYYCKITMNLTARISTVPVSLLCYKTFVEPWLWWPSDLSWWIRSKTQFSACLISQCQNYLMGRSASTPLQADYPLE